MLTAHSRVANIMSPDNKRTKIDREREGACPAIKANRRCPAIMLAANRTERVSGRIILLVISIKTIKGINTGGVPRGTKWASIEVGVFVAASSI